MSSWSRHLKASRHGEAYRTFHPYAAQQLQAAAAIMGRYHQLLMAAGATWDGMDGYLMPEGFTDKQGTELWEQANA